MDKPVLPVLVLALALTCSGVRAEEPAPMGGPERVRPHGIFTHGDSSGFMEDFYGDSVEREAPEETARGARKYDPVINWDDRRVRR